MRHFDHEYLNHCLNKDNAKINGKYINLTKRVKVSFICNCGLLGEKLFQTISNSGAFCKKCTELKRIEKCKQTCLERYGASTNLKTKDTRDKIQNTIKNKYGVDNIFQVKEVKEKSKKTILEKYGVGNISQNKEIQSKIRATHLQRFGVSCNLKSIESKEHFKNVCLERYGVENPMMSKDIQEKAKLSIYNKYGVKFPIQNTNIKYKMQQTCIRKYGVINPSQYIPIKRKIQLAQKLNCKPSYKFKNYITPFGNKQLVQGYESWALDELYKLYNEENIIINRQEVPTIYYNYNDNKRLYIPDIYIKSENKIIEVKSTWTFKCEYDKNYCKAKAAIELNYEFEFWVYDKQKNKTIYNVRDEIQKIKEKSEILAT